MPTPQPGIFAVGARTHYYVQLDLAPGADPRALRAAVAASLPGAPGSPDAVAAFAGDVWRAAGGEVPDDATRFVPVVGADGFTMPATQHDVWVWVAGDGYDDVFDRVRGVVEGVAGLATIATEERGFVYHDSRDLTGFVDGTENPPVDEAPSVATVPAGRPGEGGSLLLVQRWVHDLAAFGRLAVDEQERVIGRTKADSVELDDDVKPADAHIARVVVEDDEGEELEVFRRSTPFATLAAQGLNFVLFSADRARVDRMLSRMAGVGDGVRDRLTRFSSPTAGAYYFAPPADAL